jgi:hypothetical protein
MRFTIPVRFITCSVVIDAVLRDSAVRQGTGEKG